MGEMFAYLRVSTPKQSLARQREKILRAYPDIPDKNIFEESYTGRTLDRPKFNKLLEKVSELEGATIVFDEPSRMSRDADEGYNLYRQLYDNGINLVFLANPLINTENYRKAAQIPETGDKDFDETVRVGLNRYFLRLSERQFRLAFQKSQDEVDNLSRRTSEGMRASGATNRKDSNGNVIKQGKISKAKTGKSVTTKKSIECKAIIRKHCKKFGGSLSDVEVLKLCGCSRNAFYKYKSEVSGA